MGDNVEQKNSNVLKITVGLLWLCLCWQQQLDIADQRTLSFFTGSFDHSIPRILLFGKAFFSSLADFADSSVSLLWKPAFPSGGSDMQPMSEQGEK